MAPTHSSSLLAAVLTVGMVVVVIASGHHKKFVTFFNFVKKLTKHKHKLMGHFVGP